MTADEITQQMREAGQDGEGSRYAAQLRTLTDKLAELLQKRDITTIEATLAQVRRDADSLSEAADTPPSS